MKFTKTHGIQTYVAEGRGSFPIDMLRYDSAWPASESDAARIMRTLDYSDTLQVNRPQVQIMLRRAQVDVRSMPAVDRWRSFGWRVALTSERDPGEIHSDCTYPKCMCVRTCHFKKGVETLHDTVMRSMPGKAT